MENEESGVREPQAALDKIKILENGDPLVDLRALIPSLTYRTLLGHEAIPFLRKPVADMLASAANQLLPEYNLHVISALRDIEHQKEIYQHQYDRYRQLYPEWPDHQIRRMANKYAAPVDHPAPPGHCTGGAVDVVLQKPNGDFVDLIPPEIEDWSLAHTWTEKIDPEVRKTRMLLVKTMLDAGFSNCRDEYWHYSWGDSGWAVRTGSATCCYGLIMRS